MTDCPSNCKMCVNSVASVSGCVGSCLSKRSMSVRQSEKCLLKPSGQRFLRFRSSNYPQVLGFRSLAYLLVYMEQPFSKQAEPPPGMSCPHLPANQLSSLSGSKEWQWKAMLHLAFHQVLEESGYFLLPMRNRSSFIIRWSKQCGNRSVT